MAHSNAICVPITEGRAEPFLAAIHQAAKMADAIELRLDYLAEDDRDALRIATRHLEVTLSTRPLGCEDGQCFVGGEIELRHLSAEISRGTFYTATPKTGKTWLIGANAEFR